jgi:hypothetical protein
MADFSGFILSTNLGSFAANTISTLANGVPPSDPFLISLTSDAIGGSNDGGIPSASAHWDNVGAIVTMFGGRLFERIIVLPRVKAVGFVLSSTQFPVEVWNTFHDSAKSLTAITITGTGGITIVNPFTLPKSIGAKGSIIFQAVVPGAGDVNINLDVVFSFAGISGTDMQVTGSRILVFSVAPDWDQGIKEKISYATDILTAYDDSEQRRGLRSLPRRGLAFSATTLKARDAAGMEALIWGWQHQPYGVPFWPDQRALLADVAEGSFTIEVDTTDRLFAIGGIAMIWQDEFTFEALTVTDMDDGSLTFEAPTQFAWTAGKGTLVAPIFLGRCSNKVDVQRNWSQSDTIAIDFAGEAGQLAPTPSQSLTQFKGFDVLEVAPNWDQGLSRTYARSTVVMDPETGPITVDDKGGTPIVSHDLPWWFDSHSKITALRAFILARYGMLKPFWNPTWDADLVLAEAATSGSSVINIQSMDYTRFFFPDPARRYLALLSRAGAANRYVTVTGAIDNGDGTESLTLSAALTSDIPVDTTMISFLAFCRLSSDDTEIDWGNTEFAECPLGIQELPRELPA